jgi:hypothetical protein
MARMLRSLTREIACRLHRQLELIVNPDLVLIGLAITLYPGPLAAFIVVLASKRGITKGAAFVFGWILSLAIVIVVTVLKIMIAVWAITAPNGGSAGTLPDCMRHSA